MHNSPSDYYVQCALLCMRNTLCLVARISYFVSLNMILLHCKTGHTLQAATGLHEELRQTSWQIIITETHINIKGRQKDIATKWVWKSWKTPLMKEIMLHKS